MQGDISVLVSKDGLAHAAEEHALALRARSYLRQIVDTEDHIL